MHGYKNYMGAISTKMKITNMKTRRAAIAKVKTTANIEETTRKLSSCSNPIIFDNSFNQRKIR